MMEHFSLLGSSGIAGLLELVLSAFWKEGKQVDVWSVRIIKLSCEIMSVLVWCLDAYLEA